MTPRRLTDVETQFVVDHDDVRPPPRGMAGIHQRHFQALGRDGVGFHEAVIDEIRHRGDAGARKFRQVAVVVIAAPGFVRPCEGIADQRGQTRQRRGRRRQPANPERIEPPQRVHQGNGNGSGADHRPAQIGEDRKQERGGVAVDHHQVDEVGGHLHDVVLQPRQQHQHHHQRQRQRAGQRRTPQQCDPEEIQDSPRQQKADARAEIGFGLQHDDQRADMRCCDGEQPPDANGGKAARRRRQRRTMNLAAGAMA